MVVSVRHAFESEKTDGADATEVRPSDWNAEHIIEGLEPEELLVNVISHVKDYGAVGDGVTDDTSAIAAAIAATPDGGALYFGNGDDTYLITTTRLISQSIHLRGDGAVIKCGTNGQDGLFRFEDAFGVSITGLKFDNANKGRSLLTFDGCTDVFIEDCHFTGYTSDFGMGTSDSAIRLLTGTVRVKIVNNTFLSFGHDEEIGDDHPRCISLNDNSIDWVQIEGNLFRAVSQGIVISGGKHITVANNIFSGCSDNGVYIISGGVGTKGATITGNEFEDCEEALVILGGTTVGASTTDITIVGNRFRNWTNKALAFDGFLRYITVNGNTFVQENATGSHFIGRRGDNDQTTRGLSIVGNTFHGSTDYAAILLVTQENFVFQGNTMHLTGDATLEFFMRIDGAASTDGIIAGNIFVTDETDTQIRFANNPSGYVAYGNVLNGGRFLLGGNTGIAHFITELNVDGSPATPAHRVVFSDGAPTEGTWSRGDIAYDSTPTAGGFAGWICTTAGTPGTWKTFGVISA